MYGNKSVVLIIPARNEAAALPSVLRAVPDGIDHIIVADNGSTDDTGRLAGDFGAQVAVEPAPGYGRACLAALAALAADPPHIVAFADADGSDDLSYLPQLIQPLTVGEADFSLANRVPVEPKALSLLQRLGNVLSTKLIYLFWGHKFQDLGPMRAITWKALQGLAMSDPDYGWTVEMQVKAVQRRLKIMEIPVPYRRRKAGRSKVSGTLTGSFRAGVKILWIIGREAFWKRRILSKGMRKPTRS